ncbi:MAG: hypothetical protein HY985_18875 [Magnetospirillum sp.]|nr:hypothetical protein [Magnetospirillum sp.]
MRLPIVLFAAALLVSTPAFADQDTAIKAVRAQPRALDAVVDSGGNMYVSVKEDSKFPWSQYAAGLCQVVKPHQGRIFKVRVVDILSVMASRAPGGWKRLGEASCAN